jgi:hypothetical protein
MMMIIMMRGRGHEKGSSMSIVVMIQGFQQGLAVIEASRQTHENTIETDTCSLEILKSKCSGTEAS